MCQSLTKMDFEQMASCFENIFRNKDLQMGSSIFILSKIDWSTLYSTWKGKLVEPSRVNGGTNSSTFEKNALPGNNV